MFAFPKQELIVIKTKKTQFFANELNFAFKDETTQFPPKIAFAEKSSQKICMK